MLAALCVAGVVLTGCGVGPSRHEVATGGATGDSITSFTSCGETFALAKAPERVFTLGAEAIPTLAGLGLLDRVVARAGVYPDAYFSEAVRRQLDVIPALSEQLDATGHLHINMEAVLAQQPDLVLGTSDTINAQTLAPHHIPIVREEGYCGLSQPASFDDVWEHIQLYGTVFGVPEQADQFIERLQQQLAEAAGNGVEQRGASEVAAATSIAFLYPTVGGGSVYAYGNRSMSYAVGQAVGLRNVFDDRDERVFTVTAEEILARDPDVIVALYTDPDVQGGPAAVAAEVSQLAGADELRAVQQGAVLPMLLNYVEPPTPLAIAGVEQLRDFIAQSVRNN